MSLIKLEDVLHRIYAEPNTTDKLYQDINSLPQYNPEYGWIPVTERLPEEGFYLTYNTIGAIFETYYHPHTGWCTGGSIKETEITHYQPLINSPNK